ncbi:MAG: peptidoglycan DD-metalloendopeptidase family protein [Xanthomonadales bacterium]|nr:peptidoglycan DD-metalloendopeptidase family protein [Xanthomonadales bacterium]
MLLLLSACASPPRPQIEERSRNRPETVITRVPEYAVVRGDTMYGIAFRLGLDYRDLARWNGIHPPYTIHPGQRLKVVPPAGDVRPAVATPVRDDGVAVTAPLPDRPPPSAAPSRPVTSAPVTAPTPRHPAPLPPPKPAPPPPAKPPVTPPPPAAGNGSVVWRWPVKGRLLATFATGDPTRQGIDIDGKAGDPVLAAAAGNVVYSGSGLVGYGELIIVKHNDTWLSAYGHNRKRLVAEGDRVTAGQVIAELGRSGASRDQLHFEIRRNGKPVDPLGQLPKR